MSPFLTPRMLLIEGQCLGGCLLVYSHRGIAAGNCGILIDLESGREYDVLGGINASTKIR